MLGRFPEEGGLDSKQLQISGLWQITSHTLLQLGESAVRHSMGSTVTNSCIDLLGVLIIGLR